MAEKCGFFNSSNGDRKYKAEFFAEYFASFIANGVFPNPSTGCQVMSNGDMTVTVKTGKAWINGFYYHNDSDLILPIDVADGVLKRIDRIVLQYNIIDRTIRAAVRKGAFASTPEAPALQKDADKWELGIADVFIDAGTVSVSQSNITDLRLNTSYCGVAHGVVDQVDTETLFLQYQQWYLETTNQAEIDIEQIKADFQASFDIWFAALQNTLSGDVAGNLLLQIQSNDNDIALLQSKTTTAYITTTWIGTEPPFTQTFYNTNVTETNAVDITLSPNAGEIETTAYDDLAWKDGGQTNGTFTLKCWGVKNVVDIPIIINVRGA